MGILKLIITKIHAKSAERSGYTHQCTSKGNAEESPINGPIRIKNPPKIKNKVGYRKDLGIAFKSKMEANVFRFYKLMQTKHGKIATLEYEPEIFFFEENEFGIRSYIPDIKIVGKGFVHYIEVKGVVNEKALQKAWLFERNYPGLKLYFITPDEYKLIFQIYGKMIGHWE